MRAAEQAVIASGVPEYDLMERAGAAAAEIVWRAGGSRDVLVLCGPGNNGGDGFVIARILRAKGVPVRVAALGESRTASSLRARAAWAGPVEPLQDAQPAGQLVDALFGTGLTRGLDPQAATELGRLVDLASHSYAIDLPSGVETDSGALLSPVPRFGVGIALGAWKPAHLLYPAAGRMERLQCAEIGVAAPSDVGRLAPPSLHPPAGDEHKYSRGLVAVVGGEMAGASLLASHAAARSGAGMVRRMAAAMETGGPDAIVTIGAQTAAEVERALDDRRLAAVLAGPGLGRDDRARERLNIVLQSGHPLVLDADALNILSEGGAGPLPAGAILTPHEAEFTRLFGDRSGSKIDRALEAARRSRCIVVYKGADTVIAAPDGRARIASHASSWLSTAGTGDVLAGLVAGRLAVTRDALRAACEAVWLHGEAARRAGAAFIADDLIERLPGAIARRL
ncbi:bifunctional ADP-dependent NAD(P)H-hydrate dehydratase/NAD(P)H-hydrate epimerase [Sphingobium cloacae]|uniref:ADP-dependent (S)-NAD(P)H-hydrate dehydratase n=2 Tax=Sphingobium cloacae TaxID=120107 RepID=A0A1E1F0F4_9SPHN|nr:bifunctional ADP-dependent NAD(P)H-hydrate dehydratase/NAD(P)H-hydrate epimerase [Sphingobium cloacae]BAV63985.1 bifunctional ADP-dependent (S)-NAD(P)H-hydrate dehydratase/NAD(P)H-hydrate epimerase [Sphingobium cloacae]